MSSNTKNIGQVVGLFISTVPPLNTTLIWYDETPNQRCHKVYNPTTKLWQALNPDIISITTYSELVNNAKKNELSIGKKYQIRDKNGILATVITPTKIQYVDILGNILIDDLGTNVQYHVSSSNIFIDDVNGVLNSSNQLIFSFSDAMPNFETDYFFGKIRVGAKWVLSKFRLNKFLSKNAGNSISWQNGFFFNFAEAIKGILDKAGGIVSKKTYDDKIREIDKSINSLSTANQTIVNTVNDSIKQSTSDSSIYGKKLPINIDTTIPPGDIQRLDSLFTIISKIQRWILSFKYATGIRLSKNYKDASENEYINNNDTVESAFGKIQYRLKNLSSGVLPNNWTDKNNEEWESGDLPIANDTFSVAFSKISNFLRNILKVVKLKYNDYHNEYNSLNETKSLDEVLQNNDNSSLIKSIAQLDYNCFNISHEQIKLGVLPTDIFKIKVIVDETESVRNLTSLCDYAVGGIISENNGQYSENFVFDDSLIYSKDANALSDKYRGNQRIFSLIPLTKLSYRNWQKNINESSGIENPNIPWDYLHFINVSNSVSSALICPFKDANYQIILNLSQTWLYELSLKNKRYLKIGISADIYGNKVEQITQWYNTFLDSGSLRHNILIQGKINDLHLNNRIKPHIILTLNILPVTNLGDI